MVMRRTFGKVLSTPILEMADDKQIDTLIFIEENNVAAQKTRAAALMFIGRKGLELTTSVKGNQIWIMKDKDYPGNRIIVDLPRIRRERYDKGA